MARITVEDCIDKFPSRFELVLVASNRARKLHSGDEPTVDKNNDKNTVIALREIADETLTIENLQNSLIEEHQTISFHDEEESISEDEKNSDENEETNSKIENIYKNTVSEKEIQNIEDNNEIDTNLQEDAETKNEN